MGEPDASDSLVWDCSIGDTVGVGRVGAVSGGGVGHRAPCCTFCCCSCRHEAAATAAAEALLLSHGHAHLEDVDRSPIRAGAAWLSRHALRQRALLARAVVTLLPTSGEYLVNIAQGEGRSEAGDRRALAQDCARSCSGRTDFGFLLPSAASAVRSILYFGGEPHRKQQ
eukprot:scaffold8505_cov57-Phaeocystis_antarctica.AAC.2